MIKREELKKGDKVLIVPNSNYTRDTSVVDGQVISIGPKYISVGRLWDDGDVGRASKYNNDERMNLKDFGTNKLFLGTREEYQKYKEHEKETLALVREISPKIGVSLGYEKLSQIKAIIDS